MAGAGLLALLDDIATLLDDVAVLSKIAGKKTAGIVGDDLAVNANQLVGIDPKRELPIVWAVAKGSAVNKVILVPAALAISAAAPGIITPLLMLGGAFLCYEGVEKILHAGGGHKHTHETKPEVIIADAEDLIREEKKKIKSAVWTDFILSAEIVAVSLGVVATAPLATQAAVLASIGAAMTVGVYGLVGAIVKMDDAGLYLSQRKGGRLVDRAIRRSGETLLTAAPKLMKTLAIVGTAAMLAVGGGILIHGIPPVDAAVHAFSHAAGALLPVASALIEGVAGVASTVVVGALAGGLAIPCVKALSSVTSVCRRWFPSGRKGPDPSARPSPAKPDSAPKASR